MIYIFTRQSNINMKQFAAVFFLFLLSAEVIYAQRGFEDTVYYTRKLQKTRAKDADLYRLPVVKDNTHYKVTYITVDGKRKFEYRLLPKLIDYHYSLELDLAIKDGPYKEYTNDILIVDGTYVMNKKNGVWKTYDVDGKLSIEGSYVNGKHINEWKYYDNGKLFLLRNYIDTVNRQIYITVYDKEELKVAEGYQIEGMKNNKLDYINIGTWIYYYKNGKIKKAIDYQYDVRHGLFTYYDSVSGNKISLGWNKNGKRDSVFTSYYLNGKVRVIDNYKDGVLDGKFTRYDDSLGKVLEEGMYYKGKLYGTWKEYYYATDILKEQTDYRNDIGNAVVFDRITGKKIAEGQYNQSDKTGEWKYYNINTGKLVSIENYKEGELNGESIIFDDNGNKKIIASYINGKRNGVWQALYDDSKTVWFKADYINDTLNGLLETFYENSKPKRSEEYLMGVKIKGECYDITGNKTDCEPFFQKASFKEDVMNYIGRNLNYPPTAKEAKIEGKVIVRFTLSESGIVKNPKIIQGLNDDCNEEALRLIAQMPQWIPAKVDGMPIETMQTLPIVFWIH